MSRRDRLAGSAARFKAFFEELSQNFIERDELLRQIAFALLSREHVLVTGPPGTAKSRLAWSVLGRIVDESSGQPSLFARQFTESTVQTDLIGPINFKTLMDTGRTEHFTDQGMLGAVHAFLDEVFDGRDMLLRSALNILNERELKEGTKTTHGQIECAIMTSNRYLAEVLDGSREALLAFADRIAHIAFVPKSFADAGSLGRLLRVELARERPHPLATRLTIQDLDTLQQTVDDVELAPELCDLLAELVHDFEAEISAACRADPSFVPTRYLSTRTLVRLGKTLRAAVVYDFALGGGKRALAVARTDFWALRLALVLSGPNLKDVAALLALETDPREKRQLEILRVERELFERCLGRLRDVRIERAPRAPQAAVAKPPAEEAEQSPEQLLETARTRAVRSALSAASSLEASPIDVAQELSRMAGELENADASDRPLARWLRSEGLRMTRQALLLAPSEAGESLSAWLSGDHTLEAARAEAEARVERLASMLELQTELLSGGGSIGDGPPLAEQRRGALNRVAAELATLWDGVLLAQLEATLSGTPADQLAAIFAALTPLLGELRALDAQLAKLGHPAGELRAQVLGPRVTPLLKACCARFDARDRARALEQIVELMAILARFDLTQSVDKGQLLAAFAHALLRAEPSLPRDCKSNLAGYNELRQQSERRSLAYTLAELCLRLSEADGVTADPLDEARRALRALPAELGEQIVQKDLARVESALALLERWWAELSSAPGDAQTLLVRIEASRFLRVTRDEAALARFSLEIELLGRLLAHPALEPVAARIVELERKSTQRLAELMQSSADQRWQALASTPP